MVWWLSLNIFEIPLVASGFQPPLFWKFFCKWLGKGMQWPKKIAVEGGAMMKVLWCFNKMPFWKSNDITATRGNLFCNDSIFASNIFFITGRIALMFRKQGQFSIAQHAMNHPAWN
jgi:hypothetical protein